MEPDNPPGQSISGTVRGHDETHTSRQLTYFFHAPTVIDHPQGWSFFIPLYLQVIRSGPANNPRQCLVSRNNHAPDIEYYPKEATQWTKLFDNKRDQLALFPNLQLETCPSVVVGGGRRGCDEPEQVRT
jgi:hypothetical protein